MTTIGLPREIKDNEFRVALTPNGVSALAADGHAVLVERSAGEGSGFSDDDYAGVGATLLGAAGDVFEKADIIVKVKEPIGPELKMLRDGQTLFTYLHLAAVPEVATALLERGVTAVAYETVQLADGTLPLLAPMSEVAGRLAPQIGAHYLERPQAGRGVLLSGVPGLPPASVVVLGAGVAGVNAADVALGMGARVSLVELRMDRLRHAAENLEGNLETIASTPAAIAEAVQDADLIVGAVLVAGAAAPKVVSRAMVAAMQPGSVIVDIAVDQGGCIETTRPTSHSDPTYVDQGVTHYCVTNMPGAVPRTSTHALTNATLPYVRAIAGHGALEAAKRDAALAAGLNTHAGQVTHAAVAEALGLPHTPVAQVLG